MAPQKHIVFDVVGTCVSFDVFYDCINQILGPRLNKHFVNAKLFGFAWTEAAELEFNFLLNSERYTPFNEVFKALFYRTLWMSGIEDPRSFATDEERDLCQAAFSRLELRPGCREMMAKLRENGFTIWCLTTGDKARVKGYFDRAGFEMPIESVVSCDSFVETDASGNKLGTGVYKPSMGAYRPMLAKFEDEDEKWFAAAHMWDVSAAVEAGFRGAYCSVLEKESCKEIFDNEMDVVADSLVDMADRIVEKAA